MAKVRLKPATFEAVQITDPANLPVSVRHPVPHNEGDPPRCINGQMVEAGDWAVKRDPEGEYEIFPQEVIEVVEP